MARILLIDGDERTRGETAGLIRRHLGHELTAASTVESALVAARSDPPDLVLVRGEPPDVPALEVHKRLQSDVGGRPKVLLWSPSRAVSQDLVVEVGSALAGVEVRGPHPEALQETFDLIRDGLFLYDENGTLQLENAAGKELRTSTVPGGTEPTAHHFFVGGFESGISGPLEEVLPQFVLSTLANDQVVIGSLTRAGRQYELRAQPAAGDRVLVHVRDITDQRDHQVRRFQAEKLASIGMLAAGVAHEINNPASFVLANTEALGGLLRLMDDKIRHDPIAGKKLGLKDLLFEAMAIVQESKEGMARIHRIVRDLHAFSRVDDDPSGATDVNSAVESALTMLRNELRYRAEVSRSLEASRLVLGSSARIGQVFLNLVLNAAHALPEGALKRNRIAVRSFDDGEFVVVEIEDNGTGIAPEILPRIFDSFFTTKPPGVGTGLGLSITREIVRSSGGDISVDSTLGQGSTFRVRLPAALSFPAEDLTPTPLPPSRRRRLLAVDDEVLLLKAYRRMLIDHHDVELAAGGGEALEMLSSDREFDVILCDLQMPEMSGAEVYRTVSQRWPGLEQRFVIITGGAFSPEARGFLEEGTVTCVNKPFQLQEILEIIDRRGRRRAG